MQSDQASAVLFPDIAELAQSVGIVVHTGRWNDTDGMELGTRRKQWLVIVILQFGETRYDTATITDNTNGTTLPEAFPGLV